MASRPPTMDEHPDLQPVLTALTDEDCRRILEVLSEPMSAREIAAACDVPLSTTYRKLNRLTEASLVKDHLDVSDPGNHTTRYEADFDAVTVTVTVDGEIAVSVASDLAEAETVHPPRGREIRQQS